MEIPSLIVILVSVISLLLLPKTLSAVVRGQCNICGKNPHVPDKMKCIEMAEPDTKEAEAKTRQASSKSAINFAVVPLPFDETDSMWMHVHVSLADEDDYFRNIAIMAHNIFGYPIGQWTVDIPCVIDQKGNSSQGLQKTGRSSSRYSRQVSGMQPDGYELAYDVASVKTVSCPITLIEKRIPNFISMQFKPEMELNDVYATVRFGEKEKINFKSWSETAKGELGIQFVVTASGERHCYRNHRSGFYIVVERRFKDSKACTKMKNYTVPVECHRCFQDNVLVPALDVHTVTTLSYLITNSNYRDQIESNTAGPIDPEEPILPRKVEADIREYLRRHKPKPDKTSPTSTTTTTTPTSTTTSTTTTPTSTTTSTTTTPTSTTTTTTTPPTSTTTITTTTPTSTSTSTTKTPTSTTTSTTTTPTSTTTTSTTTTPTSTTTTTTTPPTSTTTITTTTPTSTSTSTTKTPTSTTPTSTTTSRTTTPTSTTTTTTTQQGDEGETTPPTKKTTTWKPKKTTTKHTRHNRSRTTTKPMPITGHDPDRNNTAETLDKIPSDEMYKKCEHTKGCIGEPPGCLSTRTCSSVISYVDEVGKAAFQLFGKSNKYIAMGFSADKFM